MAVGIADAVTGGGVAELTVTVAVFWHPAALVTVTV
jgi:hypothetical protein